MRHLPVAPTGASERNRCGISISSPKALAVYPTQMESVRMRVCVVGLDGFGMKHSNFDFFSQAEGWRPLHLTSAQRSVSFLKPRFDMRASCTRLTPRKALWRSRKVRRSRVIRLPSNAISDSASTELYIVSRRGPRRFFQNK